MSRQVFVALNHINDFNKSLEEGLVITVVERFEILSQEGDVSNHGKNVWRVNDFLSYGLSVLSYHGSHDCIEDKIFIAHQLNASKGSN